MTDTHRLLLFRCEADADEVFAYAKKKSNLILFVDTHPQDGLVEIARTTEVGGRQCDMVQIHCLEE